MLNIYSNGITVGVPPSRVVTPIVSRTASVGWSDYSTRNNTTFLYSVDSTSLTGFGYAFTFTLRDLPETPSHWYKIRDKFFKRCSRLGLIRYHWVTEWQRRGVPHLHGCLYFPNPLDDRSIKALKAAWCECVGKYYALQKGQDIKPILSTVGWLKYLAKHGSRSKYHYQRTSKPSEWDSSGRVWGKGGEWPTRHTQHDLGALFHRFRRLVRYWRISDARASKKPTRIAQARTCLKCNERALSSVRGMSEWIPERLALFMVAYLESLSP